MYHIPSLLWLIVKVAYQNWLISGESYVTVLASFLYGESHTNILLQLHVFMIVLTEHDIKTLFSSIASLKAILWHWNTSYLKHVKVVWFPYYKTILFIVLYKFARPQESHSGFNIPNWYFSKYQMCMWFRMVLQNTVTYIANYIATSWEFNSEDFV